MAPSEDSEDPHLDALLSGAHAVGVRLDEAGARRLLAYLDAVLEANRRINVTAIRERGDAVVRHLVDSLSVAAVWHDLAGPRPPARVLDLGTGGGFPGAPLAVVWPESEIVLVDGTGKKLRLVDECLAVAGIANAKTIWSRGADLPKKRPDLRGAFDLCVARAMGRAEVALRELAPLTASRGRIFLMKGPQPPEDEVRAARREAKHRHLLIERPQITRVPGLDHRTILSYRRGHRT